MPSRTTHESISIQPAAGQHNLLHTFQNQCWKINHSSKHDNTVANSVLVERPEMYLFHTSVNLISLDIFLFVCVYTSERYLTWQSFWLQLFKNGGSELCCMIIWSEGPPHGNICSDSRVSPLRPSEHSWESGPSRVKVPETAVITVLGKGMKADRWRDTNRKRCWSSACQTVQIRVQTLTELRQKKKEKKT